MAFGALLLGGGQIFQGFTELFSGLFNANQTDKQRKYVKQRTDMQIADAAREYNAVQGQARTQVAKSGLMIEGSAGDVLMANAGAFGRDIGRIKGQAKAERSALKKQALMQRTGAGFNALGSWLQAGDTFLGTPQDPAEGTNPDDPYAPYGKRRPKTYGARPSYLPGGGDV